MPCTAVLAPILKKFVWIAPALLRIGGCGPVMADRRSSLGGLTSKATMSFIINRIAFGTVRYCALGRAT